MTFKNLLFGCLGFFILSGAHLFPRETLSSGILFTQNDLDRSLVGYSEEEKAAILKDYALIEAICFGGKKPRDKVPQYLATAGAPGAVRHGRPGPRANGAAQCRERFAAAR